MQAVLFIRSITPNIGFEGTAKLIVRIIVTIRFATPDVNGKIDEAAILAVARA